MFASCLDGKICLVFVLLVGCAATPEPAAKAEEPRRSIQLTLPKQTGGVETPSAKPPSDPVTASTWPEYPGSKPVEGSETTEKDGEFVITTRSYKTTDAPKQVASYYRAEGVKVGRLVGMPKTTDGFQTVVVEGKDGTTSQMVATRNRDGETLVLLSTRTRATPTKD